MLGPYFKGVPLSGRNVKKTIVYQKSNGEICNFVLMMFQVKFEKQTRSKLQDGQVKSTQRAIAELFILSIGCRSLNSFWPL
jgi:hypothetical protein